jgi:uncharacterized membrane protein
MSGDKRQNFKAFLSPHRSLSREGFFALMALVIGVNFIAGTAFALAGAWPVAGFAGLDVFLVYWAFRRNFLDGRIGETIELTPHELVLLRVRGHVPVQETRLLRRNLKVELEEDLRRDLIGGLFLLSGAQRVEIGRFLAPHERRSFAGVLRDALLRAD